ncbi:hypothetical protein G3N55_10495 [Dissulfurirhabdus thermomarina]|uniref:Uncharacterized protein n=1 Tax=Dissulfurirhabdus thermomarina TaxID=1765737 RepID=A0A6N9TQD7_DISTH|nr:hypothetical protein [Dissulfurirhabdus thermomarina]NDY43268.1 hypothetical protein [Dissulfurirhabdus thermomarina]NMX24375.1 hypothetical protein [Dissulfurirhabdus thermomarina]
MEDGQIRFCREENAALGKAAVSRGAAGDFGLSGAADPLHAGGRRPVVSGRGTGGLTPHAGVG